MIRISAYRHHINKEGIPMPGCLPYDTDLYTELERMRDGYYKEVIDRCRAIEDKAERMRFKTENIPSITVSAITHTWRNLDNMIAHTGLLNIDIDADQNPHITDWYEYRDMLFNTASPIVAAFVSASGKGCSFIVRIDPEKHLDTFNGLVYEFKHLEIPVALDVVTKDKVRLRFVTHDPTMKIRYNFDELRVIPPNPYYMQEKEEQRKKILATKPVKNADSITNFRNAVQSAESDGVKFQDGEKHVFLISVAGYCNATGMSEDFCKKMVEKHYAEQTTISQDRLFKPIENIYKTYKSQHGTVSLSEHLIPPIKHLRWLLHWFDKSLIRDNLHLYGNSYLQGSSDYTIRVSSNILVFAMWLMCPEYCWTTKDIHTQQAFTNEELKELFITDHFVQATEDGKREWVKK